MSLNFSNLTKCLFRRLTRNIVPATRRANRFQPSLETLDARDVPATWTGAVSTDTSNSANWLGGVMPGDWGEASFVSDYPADCDGLAGHFAVVHLGTGYAGTVTLGGAATITEYGVEAGVLYAPDALTLSSGYVSGGALIADSTVSASGMYVNGGEVTINGAATISSLTNASPGGTIALDGGGTIGGLGMDSGTLILGDATSASTFSLSGGEVRQAPEADLTITGLQDYSDDFTWVGGTLNSTSNLANVTLTGSDTTGLIAPASGGTVYLGSNFNLNSGAGATMREGTINITNDGMAINLNTNAWMRIDAGAGLIAALTSLLSTDIQVNASTSLTVNSGTFLAAGRLTNSGTVTLKSNTTAFFPGVANDNYAYFQNGGATYLYGSQDSTYGLFTAPGKKMLISGGILNAIFDDGEYGYPALATISTKALVITGGDIYINYVPSVPHTVYGELFVAGDVTWIGGTFHPFVEGNVNAGIDHTYSDFWSISGSLSIGGTATLDPTSVVAGVPSGANAGYQWGIIMALDGITALAGTHTYNALDWTIVPVQGGNSTTWKLEAP